MTEQEGQDGSIYRCQARTCYATRYGVLSCPEVLLVQFLQLIAGLGLGRWCHAVPVSMAGLVCPMHLAWLALLLVQCTTVCIYLVGSADVLASLPDLLVNSVG